MSLDIVVKSMKDTKLKTGIVIVEAATLKKYAGLLEILMIKVY